MENLKKNFRELAKFCFEGETTVTKVNLWLVMTTCLLAGIVYGLRKAPMTHGMMIGCNNGSSFGRGTDGLQQKPGVKDEEEKPDKDCRQGRKKCGRKKNRRCA